MLEDFHAFSAAYFGEALGNIEQFHKLLVFLLTFCVDELELVEGDVSEDAVH